MGHAITCYNGPSLPSLAMKTRLVMIKDETRMPQKQETHPVETVVSDKKL